MKLSDLAPELTPDQLANCSIKIAVNWSEKKAKVAIVNESNEAVVLKDLNTTTAPTTMTQGQFWQLHHNPWLD